MSKTAGWDPELYEAKHAFVWQFGEGVIDDLDPKPGERILDIGCGPGQLTNKIAERGAQVVGLDASPEMLGQARQNYPNLQFILKDAAAMDFESEFDAVFSNAALHWMLDAAAVAKAIKRALRPNGRFVAELGGRGNIGQIEEATELALRHYPGLYQSKTRTFFPTIGDYASVLEAQGLEVRSAVLFDRPTLLEGEQGMRNFIRQFRWYYFESLPAEQQESAVQETVERLRPKLFQQGKWYADYRRLRISAVKA